MRQLVELNKNAAEFRSAGVDVIAIFREESKGVEGLSLIEEKTRFEFQLALDGRKKQTPRFAPGRGDFSSYVVNKEGIITAIINGDLKNRANSKQLLDAVAKFSPGKSGSDRKASEGSSSR